MFIKIFQSFFLFLFSFCRNCAILNCILALPAVLQAPGIHRKESERSLNNRTHGGYEDISSVSKPQGFKNKWQYFCTRFKTFFLRNQKRNLKVVLSVAICLVLVASAVGGAYVRHMLGLLNMNEGHGGNPDVTFVEETEEENLSFATMYDIASADSVKDLIKSWALNGGEKLYSKHVINVLLIGEDEEEGTHRSDSTMLVSVNTKTKKITICSFLRDAYTYMDINGSERYDKTNHSYAWGGAAKLMEVLSNNYKIKIDHYVTINFGSFIKVIDVLGGVRVPVTEKEADYMNRTTQIKGFVSGDNVLLDGQHALVYARIRKLDGEEERTRRQREVISSLIRNVKTSSLSELNQALETFLPYVTTNYKTGEILSLGTQALSDGWMKYQIVSMVEPAEEYKVGVHGYQTYTGHLDVWIVDYISCARQLQMAMFDRTNIEINPETHISAVDLVNGTYNHNAGNDEEADTTRRYYDYGDEETTRRRSYYYDEDEEDETTSRRAAWTWRGLNRDETQAPEETEETESRTSPFDRITQQSEEPPTEESPGGETNEEGEAMEP